MDNEQLVQLLKTARQEADALKATEIEPVHLLLGLAVLEDERTLRMFKVWQIDLEQLRRSARKLHPVDKDTAGAKPVLSLDGRQVLWAAEQRAAHAGHSVAMSDIFYVLMGRYWPLQPLWKQLAVNWSQTEKVLLQQALLPHTGEVFRNLNGIFEDEVVSNLLRRIGLI